MRRIARICCAVAALTAVGVGVRVAWLRMHTVAVEADVLVVGAGAAGLSAAYEASTNGARIAVAEMNSVFGGNGVLSEGGLSIVDSPLQRSRGVEDSPALAERDMLAWGEDSDPDWAHLYVNDSRREIYDWLTSLGVRFTELRANAGNHALRFHENAERGLGVVRPIARECLRRPNVAFYWNTRIERLIVRDGIATGAEGVNIRTGGRIRFTARAVVLATGGFQGNERLVRQHWPAELPQPDRILLGASPNSSGMGLQIGVAAGAATHRLDHQWHYPFGVADPRLPGENRAVSVRNLNALWINQQGNRFVNEWMSSRYTVEAVKRQQPASYWLVFDAPGIDDLRYSGTDWADPATGRRLLVGNPEITRTASSWAELGRLCGMPDGHLETTVASYNRMVAAGDDTAFNRFGPRAIEPWLMVFAPPAPRALERPPYYAMRMYAMTRKSMGGLRIDLDCRVLDAGGRPIPGLFAAGEVAGLGGLNGKAGLEGTFLGPSLVQGRRAGRYLAAKLQGGAPLKLRAVPAAAPATGSSVACRVCHTLPMRFFASLPGYRHFARGHRLAAERNDDCLRCHGEIELTPWGHRTQPLAQSAHCGECHLPRKH